ncbi:MerR family transcriptional regulator [Vibrio sp. RC27]
MDSKLEAVYAIREVSELTGVKPVTLRAWQRRYNLIQPQRTDKGHRLYSQQDVDKVNEIQRWLAKGVSIGRVVSLLELNEEEVVLGEERSLKLESCEDMSHALATLNRGRTEAIIAMTLKEYPLNIVESQFIDPILESLACVKAPLRTLQRGLFQSTLITRLSAVIESQNKASNKGKMLCISLEPVGSIYAWLWAMSKAEQGFHITLLDGVEDLSGLVEHDGLSNFKAMEIFSNKTLTEMQRRYLETLSGSPVPVTAAGTISQFDQSGS